jgi:hypothetical protein
MIFIENKKHDIKEELFLYIEKEFLIIFLSKNEDVATPSAFWSWLVFLSLLFSVNIHTNRYFCGLVKKLLEATRTTNQRSLLNFQSDIVHSLPDPIQKILKNSA